ncbi:TerD family protein [Xanthomonas nasturtii]|uniref:TerD family protein n=1 Tax=Xanthomonas TaxID=338 RepID=UPI000E1EB80F|nr:MULTISPECIES: TerD family protein [Xanthomonas]MEA9558016.1 TerD family protein [Xanthomonas nasturtii]MEA9565353.1 TerD family protein [Xanthomonas sp. WHRI 8932A]MEA9579765.1 TerD family protein [Xanthomonas nasturtii]MEA9589339.1 TerD family protein [Xanthomonas sp. WHRI 10064B]MEA9616738.1 TerD family protein [Xanthomonas sp. WHRI 10064A]
MSVSLSKGQRISLSKEGGAQLTKVVMGLGWDAKKTKGFLGFGQRDQSIDLDASCLMFNDANQLVDQIWFQQLDSRDGSVRHTGDNRTGDGDGDDEQIVVQLDKIPTGIKSLVFIVNSFTGQSFAEIENAFCRLVDANGNKEVARYNLSCQGNHTAQLMAKLYRHENDWKLHAIGESCSGRTFHDMLPVINGQL